MFVANAVILLRESSFNLRKLIYYYLLWICKTCKFWLLQFSLSFYPLFPFRSPCYLLLYC